MTLARRPNPMPPAFSLFEEAIHLIHQRWENRDGFAVAVAETLKALFGIRMVYIGSTYIKSGIRQPLFNNLVAELDPALVRSLQEKIEQCSAAFVQSGDKLPRPSSSWDQGNPYAGLSRSFFLGGKLGALIPVWHCGVLVDIFTELPDETAPDNFQDLFDRLIPHLEIACSRVWMQSQALNLDGIFDRLQNKGLTAREAEVVMWVLQGKTNPEIAAIMGVGLQTIKNHLANVYPKLGVENRSSVFALLVGGSWSK
jgi:DNA-binding CsgD family transcriptional regulator